MGWKRAFKPMSLALVHSLYMRLDSSNKVGSNALKWDDGYHRLLYASTIVLPKQTYTVSITKEKKGVVNNAWTEMHVNFTDVISSSSQKVKS